MSQQQQTTKPSTAESQLCLEECYAPEEQEEEWEIRHGFVVIKMIRKQGNRKTVKIRYIRVDNNESATAAAKEVKNYITGSIADLDVLLGNYSQLGLHPGNATFIKEAEKLLTRYTEARLFEKQAIIQELVDIINKKGGRFLNLDQRNEKWYIVDNAIACIKASQAFREMNVNNIDCAAAAIIGKEVVVNMAGQFSNLNQRNAKQLKKIYNVLMGEVCKKKKTKNDVEAKKYITDSITDLDVLLLSRHFEAMDHPGNQAFLQLAKQIRPKFKEASDKDTILQELVDMINGKGGRFLKLDETNKQQWYVVNNFAARQQALQALQGSTADEREKISKALQSRKF